MVVPLVKHMSRICEALSLIIALSSTACVLAPSQTPAELRMVFTIILFVFYFVGKHSQQYSGLTSGSAFRDPSRLAQGPYEIPGVEPQLAACKASSLPASLSFQHPIQSF